MQKKSIDKLNENWLNFRKRRWEIRKPWQDQLQTMALTCSKNHSPEELRGKRNFDENFVDKQTNNEENNSLKSWRCNLKKLEKNEKIESIEHFSFHLPGKHDYLRFSLTLSQLVSICNIILLKQEKHVKCISRQWTWIRWKKENFTKLEKKKKFKKFFYGKLEKKCFSVFILYPL